MTGTFVGILVTGTYLLWRLLREVVYWSYRAYRSYADQHREVS